MTAKKKTRKTRTAAKAENQPALMDTVVEEARKAMELVRSAGLDFLRMADELEVELIRMDDAAGRKSGFLPTIRLGEAKDLPEQVQMDLHMEDRDFDCLYAQALLGMTRDEIRQLIVSEFIRQCLVETVEDMEDTGE